jgi:hypothetical protein
MAIKLFRRFVPLPFVRPITSLAITLRIFFTHFLILDFYFDGYINNIPSIPPRIIPFITDIVIANQKSFLLINLFRCF